MKNLAITVAVLFFTIATIFSVIRHSELANQNIVLKSDLAELRKKVDELETIIKNKSFDMPAKSVNCNINTSDIGVTTKISDLEKKIAFLDNKYQQAAREVQGNTISLDGDAFQEAFNKASQKSIIDRFRNSLYSTDKRYIEFLEKELFISQAQKDQITQALKTQEDAAVELFQKDYSTIRFQGPEYYQQENKINQETENNVTATLSSAQLVKFKQLKEEGKINVFHVW